MADTPAYMVANFQITDRDEYRKYEKGFFPVLKKHGGEFFTYSDDTETVEGRSPRTGCMVMAKFPSIKAARAWYNDPEYQALSKYRRAGTELEFLTLIPGLPPRN